MSTPSVPSVASAEEIYKTLVVSISHLPYSDFQKLEEAAISSQMIVYSYPYGIRVYLHPTEPLECRRQAMELGLSDETIALLAYGATRSCRWLELDRDAEIHPRFPTFDWP